MTQQQAPAITPKVERKNGGMPKWAVLGLTVADGKIQRFWPYTSDVGGRRFLTRFIFFFTEYAGCHVTLISQADNQREFPHDHSATFVSFRLTGSYEEDVFTDPADLTRREHRTHRWLSASRLRHAEAHSITKISRFPLITILFLGRRRQKSNYWTPSGKQPLGMKMDGTPEDEWG